MKFIKVRYNVDGKEIQKIINTDRIEEIYEIEVGSRIYFIDDDNITTTNTIDELFEMLNK